MNLSDVLSRAAEDHGDRVALVFGDRRVTFGELDSEASRVASALSKLGVEPGERVAIWLPNHPVFASVLYGSWKFGAVAVPVHSELTRHETRHILDDSEARLLVCGAEQHAKLSADAAELTSLDHVVVLDPPGPADLSYDGLLSAGTADPPKAQLPPDHLAVIAYTSGTAGLPKGAMLTHANLLANLQQMSQLPVSVRADDVSLCVLPMFHIFGLNVVLNLAVAAGSTLVLTERFDPRASLDLIARERITVLAAAPPAYVAWLSLPDAPHDAFASVRMAVSGAAALPREVLSGFAERFGVTIWEGYGLTETAPVLTSTSVGGKPKPGSVGRAIPGVEIRLMNDYGEDVEPGDPGEVCVRGPNVFRGYWGHPEETARAFRDGWFRTGDVAVADDEGDLFIVDRKRDMIIVSGFNVYPREVEDAVRRHPKVADCAVVGAPDPYSGEQVQAYVVPAQGAELEAAELRAHCEDRLAPYKVPASIEVVSEIPRNAAGKVLRRVLRD